MINLKQVDEIRYLCTNIISLYHSGSKSKAEYARLLKSIPVIPKKEEETPLTCVCFDFLYSRESPSRNCLYKIIWMIWKALPPVIQTMLLHPYISLRLSFMNTATSAFLQSVYMSSIHSFFGTTLSFLFPDSAPMITQST